MTTVLSVRTLNPVHLGDSPEVAQVTDPDAAEAVARLMGQTMIVIPVKLPRPAGKPCFLCNPEPFNFEFKLFPFSALPKYWLAHPGAI